MTTAGLLHHFESKEQLLHAVLDARDADDMAHVDMSSDVIQQLENVTDRFQRSPDLIGLFTVLQSENLNPDAPLHDRFLGRYRDAVAIVTEGIRRGQQSGAYRADLDPAVKAVEIIAFLHGMETSWLPSADRGVCANPSLAACPQSIAVRTDLYDADDRVRRLVLAATERGGAEIRLWGDVWPEDFDGRAVSVSHRLSLIPYTRNI